MQVFLQKQNCEFIIFFPASSWKALHRRSVDHGCIVGYLNVCGLGECLSEPQQLIETTSLSTVVEDSTCILIINRNLWPNYMAVWEEPSEAMLFSKSDSQCGERNPCLLLQEVGRGGRSWNMLRVPP